MADTFFVEAQAQENNYPQRPRSLVSLELLDDFIPSSVLYLIILDDIFIPFCDPCLYIPPTIEFAALITEFII